MAKRNLLIDIIKTLLIIMVVLGHCIQFGSGKDYFNKVSFFDNCFFIFIYSFHMPAFMIISGYLFGLSNKTNTFQIIKNKIKHLLVPIFVWSILITLMYAIHDGTFDILWIIKSYIIRSIYDLWFLWAVFYSTFISTIIKNYFNNNIYIHYFLILISFFIPDILNLHLYKFVYPFFVIGFYFHYIQNIIFRHKKMILAISTLLFIILLSIYNRDSYIYITKHFVNSYYQLYIDIYRYLIGLVGSCSTFMWIYYLKNIFIRILSPISFIGEKTMGIYIISNTLNMILLVITKEIQSFNLAYLILETCTIITLSLIIIKFLEQYKFTKKYLLGIYK